MEYKDNNDEVKDWLDKENEKEQQEIRFEERKKKRLAYGVIILICSAIYIFGNLIAREYISPAEAIIVAIIDLYAIYLCGVI